jgi:hypothetical protein
MIVAISLVQFALGYLVWVRFFGLGYFDLKYFDLGRFELRYFGLGYFGLGYFGFVVVTVKRDAGVIGSFANY